jgi:nucleoside-diphosphate-sugar epimerase
MQINVDTEILETITTHATTARRLVGSINDASDRAIVIDTITASINEIVRALAELLGDPHPIAAPVPSARPSYDDEEPTEVRSCPALPTRKRLVEGVQ